MDLKHHYLIIAILAILIVLITFYILQQFKKEKFANYVEQASNVQIKSCEVYFTPDYINCDNGKSDHPPLYWTIKINQLKAQIGSNTPTPEQQKQMEFYQNSLKYQANMPNANCRITIPNFGQVYDKAETIPPLFGNNPENANRGTPNNWAFCYTGYPQNLPPDNSTIQKDIGPNNTPSIANFNGYEVQRIKFNDFNKDNIKNYACAINSGYDTASPDGLIINLNPSGTITDVKIRVNQNIVNFATIDIDYALYLFTQYYDIKITTNGNEETITATPIEVGKYVRVGKMNPCGNRSWNVVDNMVRVKFNTTTVLKTVSARPDPNLGNYQKGYLGSLNSSKNRLQGELYDINRQINSTSNTLNSIVNWIGQNTGWYNYCQWVINLFNAEIARLRTQYW